MEKIKLNNGQEFELVPMGVRSTDKYREFSFTSVLPYSEIDLILSNSLNLNTAQYILESGDVTTYHDLVELIELRAKKNVLVGEITTTVYTAVISVDAIGKKIAEVQRYTDNAVCELTMLLSMLLM
jgi:hypothetical protein